MLPEDVRHTIKRRLRRYGYTTYSEYLQSDHWKKVRRRFFKSKLFHGCCHCCGAAGPIEVHHVTYSRLGKEWLNDLIALCPDCHHETHIYAITGTNLRNAHKRIWREYHRKHRRREPQWNKYSPYWRQNREIDKIRDRILREAKEEAKEANHVAWLIGAFSAKP